MPYTERLARLLLTLLKTCLFGAVFLWLLRVLALVFVMASGTGPQSRLADDIEAMQAAHPQAGHKLTRQQLDQMRALYR